jgi:heme exporter protein A
MLQAIDLECQRGERLLFSGLNFSVARGTCLHVAGPNGAGKTSLQRIVCGLLQPTAGEVRFGGENIRSLREEYWQSLAYVGHQNGVKDDLTVEENVYFAAGLAGRAATHGEVRAALEQVGLSGFEAQLARHLSQGQKRRAALARLFLAAAATVWVLDEPFTALDVRGVAALSALVAQHLRRDGLVVLTTHQEVPIDGRVERLVLDSAPAGGAPAAADSEAGAAA